jgi:GT2 family glycosyltransferase
MTKQAGPAMAGPDVSIVIVTRNVRSMLRDCLLSLHADLDGDLTSEVFVVDNASSDGSASMVRDEFPWARLFVNVEDRGFAASNNVAFKHCAGRHVMMLNSDTIVHKGAVPALVRYLDENPRVGMVGPRLVNPDGTTQRSCWKLPSLTRVLYEALMLDAAFRSRSRFGNYEDWNHDRERSIEFIVSAAVMIRGAALERVGQLDEQYFIFGDDYDWSRRLHNAGWQTMYYPTAEITHFGGQSTSAVAPVASIVEATKSKDKYYRKFYGPHGYLLYKSLSIIGCTVRVSLLSVAPRLSPKNRHAGHDITRSRYLAQLKYHVGRGDRRGLAPKRQ